MQGKLFVITGPSGVGKTTVSKKLREQIPNLKKLVTYTTRTIRENEVDGIDYHFVDKDTFEGMINRGELFEWAEVYEHLYGNRIKDLESLLEEGGATILVIDAQGAKTVESIQPDAVTIFLTAESPDIIAERIKKRGKFDTEDLQKRIAALEEEMQFAESADFVVQNKEGVLDETIIQIQHIIEENL